MSRIVLGASDSRDPVHELCATSIVCRVYTSVGTTPSASCHTTIYHQVQSNMPETKATTPAPKTPHIAVRSALRSLKAALPVPPVAVLPPVVAVLLALDPEPEVDELPEVPEVRTEELTPNALM